MTRNTLTLSLKGDVPLNEFAKAMGHFSALVESLTEDVSGKTKIEWQISNLRSGSATAVIMGRSTSAAAIEKVVRAYEVVGDAIQRNKPIPYSEKISREARAITQLLNGKIKSIEFITDESGFATEKPFEYQELNAQEFSFGTVTGKVETLSKRGKVRFILYDNIFDRAVNCYLGQGQESLMLDAWDHYITVAGHVYRDAITGRPTDVREINYIAPVERKPYSLMSLAGILPWQEGDECPEDAVRRLRDAE